MKRDVVLIKNFELKKILPSVVRWANIFNEATWSKYVLTFLIFLISIWIMNASLVWEKAPILFSDSPTYINFANEIKERVIPNTSLRTPTYPILLYLAKIDLSLVILIQLLLGALTSVFLFLIANKVFRNNLLSFFITLLIALDYQINQFQSTILSETLATFLLSVFVFLHLIRISRKGLSSLFSAVVLVIDLLLVFSKPIFVLLPILVYALELFAKCINRDNSLRKEIFVILLLVSINILGVLGYCCINNYRYGFWGFSYVSEQNKTIQLIQQGFLSDKYNYGESSEVMGLVKKIYQSLPESPNRPWSVVIGLRERSNGPKEYSQMLREINSTILDKYKSSFYLSGVKNINSVLRIKRNFYVPTNSSIVGYLEPFYRILYSLFPWSIILVLLSTTINILNRKNHDYTAKVLFLLMVVLYMVVAISFLSPGEFARLRVPVNPYLIFLTFYSVYFIVTMLLAKSFSKFFNRFINERKLPERL